MTALLLLGAAGSPPGAPRAARLLLQLPLGYLPAAAGRLRRGFLGLGDLPAGATESGLFARGLLGLARIHAPEHLAHLGVIACVEEGVARGYLPLAVEVKQRLVAGLHAPVGALLHDRVG